MATSGWKQWTEAEARAAVGEWRASGLTVKAFCAPRGYSRTRIHTWRDRFDAADKLGKRVEGRRRKIHVTKIAAVALVPTLTATGIASFPGDLPPAVDAPAPEPAPVDALATAYVSALKGVDQREPGALARLKAIADAGHTPAQLALGGSMKAARPA